LFRVAFKICTSALTGAAPNLPDRLPPDWYRRKIAQVQQEMAKRNLDALVPLRAVNVIYTTGYFHLFSIVTAIRWILATKTGARDIKTRCCTERFPEYDTPRH
jgi:hypothetical protein